MFEAKYEKLSSKEKEEFIYIANKMLAKNYILRDVYTEKEKGIKTNYDYRFIERNLSVFEEYFNFSGWDVNVDIKYGVVSMKNRYELNKAVFNKVTTIFLLTLRLIYDEEREKLSLKREILISTHDIVSKLLSIGTYKKKPSDKEIQTTLRQISKFNIIDKLSGAWSDPSTQIIIYPSILFVMTDAKINDLASLIVTGEEEVSDEDN